MKLLSSRHALLTLLLLCFVPLTTTAQDTTRKYLGKSVTTVDFQKEMERAGGNSLAPFFDKWVYLKKTD